MNQLTIRGFPPDLEKALRTTAKNRGISMSKAALYLMRRGAELPSYEDESFVIGSSLDAYFGSLSREEADAVTIAVEQLDRIQDREFGN
jgi:hypothetical protein